LAKRNKAHLLELNCKAETKIFSRLLSGRLKHKPLLSTTKEKAAIKLAAFFRLLN
jgi:hypothetical protein